MTTIDIGVGEPKKPYKPVSAVVDAFHASSARMKLLVGPFGSGKSVAAIFELLRNATLSHNSRFVIVRDSYRNLMDTCIRTFFSCIPEAAGTWQKSELIFTMPSYTGGQIEFMFRSAETEDDVAKFHGLEITGFWLDEAKDLSPDVKMILSGRMRYPLDHPYYVGLFTTNPCDTEHWLYQQFVANPLDGHAYWRQTANENKHLPKNYYEDMAAAFRDRPEMYRRYVLGEWGAVFSGKAVYGEEFHFDTHVGKGPIVPVMEQTIVRSWDFGLTPACVFSQVHPNGQWIVLREVWSDNSSIDEFSDAVLAVSSRFFTGFKFEDVGDPAGKARAPTDESTCYDVLASKGIFCTEAPTNDLIPRLESVKRRLIRTRKGHPLMIIDPRCKRLIDGFSGGYRFKERGATQTYADTPEKNQYSHIHDALQYGALYLFGYADFNQRVFTEKLDLRNLGVIGA